jgi:hypothetical protein
MNRGLQVIFTLAIGLLLGAAGMQSAAQSPRGGGNPAQPEARPAQRGEDVPPLSSFNILLYRHIFDPNRQFDTNYVPPQTNYTPVAPKIALNGVFIDKSEVVAIFEGTSPEYNAAVHVGGVIAGHKLVEIHPDRVLMSINDKPLEMMVADKMIQDLKTKGVHADVIEKTVGAAYAGVNEEKLAREFLRKKRSTKPKDQKESARIFRRMVRAGFSSRVVIKVLRSWDAEEETLVASY